MKKVLSIILLSLTLSGLAQTGNGGQQGENVFVRFRYIGFNNGYIVQVVNKQSCSVNFQLSWLSHDSTSVFVNASDSVTYTLPEAPIGGTSLKVKPLVRCVPGGGDMGWLEINAPQNIFALAVKFGYIKVDPRRTSEGKIRITYSILTATGHNTAFLRIKTMGKDGTPVMLRIQLPASYATEGTHVYDYSDK